MAVQVSKRKEKILDGTYVVNDLIYEYGTHGSPSFLNYKIC